MGILRGPDFFYAIRFLRLLTTRWDKTEAFKQGVLDKDGTVLKKPETKEEKSSYTVFHKLVYNIKRLINKLPLGKSTIASYAAALFLIKEHTGISDNKLKEVIKEACGLDLKDYKPEINEWYSTQDGNIEIGKYALINDVALPKTGDTLAKKGTLVNIIESAPCGSILGHSVYSAIHLTTNQKVYITQCDIEKG